MSAQPCPLTFGEELERSFDAQRVEALLYPWWEESGVFKGDASEEKPPFCIVIPPPNVTGNLHMGHALDNTLQDCLVRYKRMDGYNAVWIPGTDHAGIATQWVVERSLREQGLERKEMGREAFVEKVWAWKEKHGGQITHQLRRLGTSCDWSREAFTMDEGLSLAVREVFVRLYEQGLIYRGQRLVNWDPEAHTVLSDLEVDHEEGYQGELWSFAYPLKDEEGEIVVATTRPETMLGDTAVAVHPEDPRYQHLIGKKVWNPLVEREIPIIADPILVDPAFGTGAVKVTPAHDPNDFEVGRRHDLEFLNIFDWSACVNEQGGRFQGMERYAARKAVKEAMAELGLDRGTQVHVMSVGRSQRSGVIVEPMLSTQWFMKMQPLAAPAIAAVRHGHTRFIPSRWEKTYFHWMENIRDWCISRQLWWGHRIPAWYCQDCDSTLVMREEPSSCPHCGSERLQQDEDVLDTWFSSALWPFSTLGWPDAEAADLQRWYPTSVLVTGFDIIFFWVARMMFSGLHQVGAVPFKEVFIHGLVRDEHGQKMSKSKGNGVDPLLAIEAHGCDAFRFALLHAATADGADFNWSEERMGMPTRFVNKIWQALRYAHMNLRDYSPDAEWTAGPYDRWILARCGQASDRIRQALDAYRFHDAAAELQAFIWGELCDWYLEFSKSAIYGGGEARAAAQATLVEALSAAARLLHPMMPFLSEAIWQALPEVVRTRHGDSISRAPYPKPSDYPQDEELLQGIEVLQGVIGEVRRIKAEMNLSPGKRVRLMVEPALAPRLEGHEASLEHLAKVESWSALDGEPQEQVVTGVVPAGRLFLPLEGLVDKEAELARLAEEIVKVTKDVKDLEKRLGNQSFVERAPAAVVEKFRARLAGARERLESLSSAQEALQ